MSIGENIKQRREELGMTQTELANKLGYADKSSISKIEKGNNDIFQSDVARFAKVLDTTPAHLMGWEPSPDGKLLPFELMPERAEILSDLEYTVIDAFRKADEVDRHSVLRVLGIDTKSMQEKKQIENLINDYKKAKTS